jgi:hypothetical protein
MTAEMVEQALRKEELGWTDQNGVVLRIPPLEL